MDWTSGYDEQTWRNDADFRERAEAKRERIEMQDVIFDHAELARCDGSGVLDETYIDVDQTRVIACPGCVACRLEKELAATPATGEDELEYRRRVA
jgi:hypothetical protein